MKQVKSETNDPINLIDDDDEVSVATADVENVPPTRLGVFKAKTQMHRANAAVSEAESMLLLLKEKQAAELTAAERNVLRLKEEANARTAKHNRLRDALVQSLPPTHTAMQQSSIATTTSSKPMSASAASAPNSVGDRSAASGSGTPRSVTNITSTTAATSPSAATTASAHLQLQYDQYMAETNGAAGSGSGSGSGAGASPAYVQQPPAESQVHDGYWPHSPYTAALNAVQHTNPAPTTVVRTTASLFSPPPPRYPTLSAAAAAPPPTAPPATASALRSAGGLMRGAPMFTPPPPPPPAAVAALRSAGGLMRGGFYHPR